MVDDAMLFDDDESPAPAAALPPWEILIVDDEQAVHQVTELVMSDFEFDGRRVHFSHCYSGSEARVRLAQPGQFALILLDVVMESEHAGLELVRYIREELGDRNVRIVLRTGQPGQAPQALVLKTYDINDYREKTELTHAKLSTVFYSGLRAYRDLMRLERARLGLRRSIEAITHVCDSDNLRHFCSAVLEQASALLGREAEGVCASRMNAYAAARQPGRLQVLAVTTAYAELALEETLDHLPAPVRDAFVRCMAEQADHYGPLYYACYYRTRDGNESLLYMSFSEPLEGEERELLGLFSANVAITYERLLAREELEATQDAIIHILGEALERRSAAAGGHVERVGEIAAMLGAAVDMPDNAVRQLRQAAPLHDIGHAGIPDEILNQPGPLDAAQRTRMQGHSDIGWHMLSGSRQPVLQLAARIAHEHHERWDGAGYPQGLQGADISLVARITALADFVDAMVSPRSYRPAHTLQHALDAVREGSGKRFDPALANLLLQHQDDLQDLYRRHPPH
ncbi:Response regulator c-di-GMP phosphodiesterase, RpfG family, contains REC and HD-GYP domains [Duganella sp. CF458]|uniref:HD domain-containing phosphohydrolase n=1 Tax=Duganella sp. CF458 TaxID=1884368 RepID=UPI0008ED0614|nr:HD domain-containing phosphohydrolase [Duganella sp. CF458]SFG00279.1 Response regulator c-di-GMP phosphodiesterase, RpfG family, contains REC and HD-GYP domains [Duganella sp. CF458]